MALIEMKYIQINIYIILLFLFGCRTLNLHSETLYQKEKVIVISNDASNQVALAAKDLQQHIQLATSEFIPIIRDTSVGILNDKYLICVGISNYNRGEYDSIANSLSYDEILLKSDSNKLEILGNPKSNLPSVHYAVSHLIEFLFDARWFYPGIKGTSLKKNTEFVIPSIDVRWKPELPMRIIGHSKNIDDSTRLWLIHHRLGAVDTLNYNHSFKDWYPELLPYLSKKPATLIKDKNEIDEYREGYIKFRFQDKGFRNAVVSRWYKQGKPGIYNISLPDGHGYDSSTVQDVDPIALWNGKISVTKPYLDFCQYVDKEINKGTNKTRFFIYSYSAYNKMPNDYLFDGGNFIVSYVSYTMDSIDLNNWRLWNRSGATMILRPNWWMKGYFTSYAPYERQGHFFEEILKEDMKGFYIDILKEQWASHGFEYYLIARLTYSGKSYEEIEAEYTDFYGPYKNRVSKYLKLSETLFWSELIGENGSHKNFVKRNRGEYQEFNTTIDINDLYKLKSILIGDAELDETEPYDSRLLWLSSSVETSIDLLNYYSTNFKVQSKESTIKLIDDLRNREKSNPYCYNTEKFIRYYVLPFKYNNYTRDEYEINLKKLSGKN